MLNLSAFWKTEYGDLREAYVLVQSLIQHC